MPRSIKRSLTAVLILLLAVWGYNARQPAARHDTVASVTQSALRGQGANGAGLKATKHPLPTLRRNAESGGSQAARATPSPTHTPLAKGEKGDEVVRLQERLDELGYSVGSADGQFGAKTQTAVKHFQRAAGLRETGIADHATLDLLHSRQAFSYGAPPTPEPTLRPTAKPRQESMVWIPRTGKRYHRREGCSNMKSPSCVTLSEAKSLGFTPCKKCY